MPGGMMLRGRQADAAGDVADQGGAIDRLVQRAAHADVVERRLGVVDVHPELGQLVVLPRLLRQIRVLQHDVDDRSGTRVQSRSPFRYAA